MGNDENTTKPFKKDRENLEGFFKFYAALPTETAGILKNFMDRGGGSAILGAWNFFKETYGKPKEGEITVPYDQIEDDRLLPTYLDNMKKRHRINNAEEIQNSEDEWYGHYDSLIEKYNLTGNVDDLQFALSEKMNDDEREKLVNLGFAYDAARLPFQENDEDDDGVPESITFRHDLLGKTPMEPDVKFIDENSISFPYLGKYTFDDEGQFTMEQPSVYKPLDQPGIEGLLDKTPVVGDALQKWQNYVTPGYSPEPELFQNRGWQTGMATLFGSQILPYAKYLKKPATWAGKKILQANRLNPYAAGILTAMTPSSGAGTEELEWERQNIINMENQ
jgi:hypothetical protein